MANPVIVHCTADSWTKVATNVRTGNIFITDRTPDAYYQTYKMTGEAPPSGIASGAVFDPSGMTIDASTAIDVYIWPQGNNGEVRVDL